MIAAVSAKSIRSILVVGALSALAVACSQGGGSDGDDGMANPAAVGELQGAWKSNCRDATKFGLTESSRLVISGPTATQVTTSSSSGTCGTPAVETTQTATIAAGAPVGEGRAVDIKITNVRVKPLSEIGVGVLNLAAFCGVTDWAVGQERDVTAASGSASCFPKLPRTHYDIFLVDGGKLYFGKGDITSAELRPQVIDRMRLFDQE